MQQEETSSAQQLLPYSPIIDFAVSLPKDGRDNPQLALSQLADEMIDGCCGSHSLGLVYRFLRNAGMNEVEARAQFELFLSGTLSEKLLDTATRCIGARP
jgi:hypothetical protein